jgi:uracil-DNA glycosylase
VTQIADFLAELAAVPSTNVMCNVYHADQEGSARRLAALATYLEEQWDAPLLLVGEAPGHLGARLSGVPFTDERTLYGHGQGEVTARRVHRALEDFGLSRTVMLWNVVPFHPHHAGEPRSNRTPKAAERRLTKHFAEKLAAGRTLVCIGRHAEKSFPGAHYIRHPARNGEAEFRRGMAELARTVVGGTHTDARRY